MKLSENVELDSLQKKGVLLDLWGLEIVEGGRRESVKNLISPNLSTPVFFCFVFCPPLLKCFERFKPAAILRQHVYRHAWFAFFECLTEVSHV